MTEVIAEIRIATFYKDESGIIVCKWKEVDPFPTYEDCLEMIQVKLELANFKPFVVLTDFRDVFGTLDEQSKKLFAEHEELNRLKIADALLVNTLPIQLLVKSYLILFKPKAETKVFKDFNASKKWLIEKRAGFVDKNY